MNTVSASEYLLESSKEYALYVAQYRALPNVTDGLKASQRKILWSIRNQADKIKTISLAGKMISDGIFVHGDQSASSTISHMAGPYLNNLCFIEGHGAFGSRVSPRSWGAPRYTYVKKTKITDAVIYPDMDIVPLKENYDGSAFEPVTFLPLIPLVLLNGIEGIAVGWSTSILPRALDDIINATIQAIDGNPVKRMVPTFEYLKLDTVRLDKNVWEFRGVINKVDSTTVNVSELPPSLSIDKFKDRLNDMEEKDLILDYTDNSTDQVDIEIKLKRSVLEAISADQLLDYFQLKEKNTERVVVVNWDGASIRQYKSAEILVKEFVDWRIGWYWKRYQKFEQDDSYELRYWKSLELLFNKGLPEKIQAMKNKAELETEVQEMTKKVEPDDKQIDKILQLPTHKWCQDFLIEIKKKISELEENIKRYRSILKSPDEIRSIYKAEVLELKKLS